MNKISPELISEAVELSRDGIVITDANQDENPIVYVNQAFCDMTGNSREEVMGRNCRFLQGDDDKQESINELREKLSKGEECLVTIRNYKKDGTLFYDELSITPIRNKQGQITHFIGIQNDVTEMTQKIEELERINDLMVDRELKMTELKRKIKDLEE